MILPRENMDGGPEKRLWTFQIKCSRTEDLSSVIEAHGVAESMCKKCLEEVELVSLLVSSSWRETYPT